VLLKNAPLCMPIPGSLHTLQYICPLQGHPSPKHIRGSQKCPSVYAHVRVSTHTALHMPTARTTLSKCTYVVLKNDPLCMPMSGSLYTLPYICPLQGHPSPNAHTWFSKMPLCVCKYQGL